MEGHCTLPDVIRSAANSLKSLYSMKIIRQNKIPRPLLNGSSVAIK